ncbi:uncharacterized protein [Lepeophtheirus salmonis]|uniref:uncharacterized protein n=1 Tax=Lepeophtheirus salmonis TaxID=72036 RepID=UPI001AE9E4C4|nr:uncharacterized protein LOC121124669 [Lepeophtheirus salmonis]
MDQRLNFKIYIRLLVVCQLITTSKGWLWYTPASRDQTIADCKKMKDNKSPFYPSYCEELLTNNHKGGFLSSPTSNVQHTGTHTQQNHHLLSPNIQQQHQQGILPNVPSHLMAHINPSTMIHTQPLITKGWGWSNWSEWTNDACPESCGRRCRGRTRYCFGSFRISCMGHGSEFDNCPGNKGSPYQWNNGANTPGIHGNNAQHSVSHDNSNGNPMTNLGGIGVGNNGGPMVLGAGLFGSGSNGGIFQNGNIGSNGIDDSLLKGDSNRGSYGNSNGVPLLSSHGLSNNNRRDRRRRVRRPVKKDPVVKELPIT